MNAVSSETETQTSLIDNNGANGQSAPDDPGWPVPRFHPGLGDHPLWQALMDEIEKNRQEDIAEMNRLADLELAELAQEK